MLDPIYRIALGVVFSAALALIIPYRSRAQRGQKFDTSVEGASYVVLRLTGLVIWLYPVALVAAPALVAWSLFSLPSWAHWAGVVVAVLCQPLVWWAQRSLGDNVTTTVVTRKKHQLVTSGPYRWVRNPLYSIGVLFLASLGLIGGSWFLLLASAAALGAVTLRLPKEEAQLEQRFGEDYRSYRKQAGRFLPRLRSAEAIRG